MTTASDERREQVRRLARSFAEHLRHLREFRGVGYVSAAPSPRRPVEAATAKSLSAPTGAATSEPGEARAPEFVAGAASTSASSRAPTGDAASAPNARPPAAPAPGVATSASRVAPAGARTPERAAPAEAAWSSGQVSSEVRRADADGPRAGARTWPEDQARSAPPSARAPGSASSASLPIVSSSQPATRQADVGRGEAALRAQAQAWTPEQKLAYLRSKNIGNCTRCKLARGRTNIVFGVGDPAARLMFIGEAPGADEDRQGEPFVGAAGKRLTLWIERLGMTRSQVYIANVLKCRPPGNRDPEPDEIEKCSPFLKAQIRAIRPELIVALGRYAGILLLGKHEDTLLKEMRSRAWTYEDASAELRIPLYVTYHPSYVIRRERELPPGQRNPADDTVMSDLERALRVLHTRR